LPVVVMCHVVRVSKEVMVDDVCKGGMV